MHSASAFPLWLKYLIGFGLACFILPFLDAAPYSEMAITLGGWLAFVLLALFPGNRPGFPRMFSVLSVLWVLVSVGALILIVNDHLWRDFASGLQPDDGEALPAFYLISCVVLYPALTLALWFRSRAFRPLVVVVASYSILGTVLIHAHGPRATLWVTVLDVLLDIAIAAYLLIHFRARLDPDRLTKAPHPTPIEA